MKEGKTKSIVKILVALVLLGIILALATPLAKLLLVPSEKAFTPYRFTEEMASDEIYSAVTDVQYASDVEETLLISGWAADITGNTDNEVRLVLSGSKGAYISDKLKLTAREQVNRFFGIDGNTAFTAQTSTLGIKNGVYDIYIEVSSESGLKALTYTGRSIKKYGTRLTNATVATVCELGTPIYDESIDCAIMPVAESEVGLVIAGFCKKPDVDSRKVTLYAKTEQNGKEQYFELFRMNSVDAYVGSTNIEAVQCSFNTSIPRSSLENGEVRISIVLESDGQLLSTKVVGGYVLQ